MTDTINKIIETVTGIFSSKDTPLPDGQTDEQGNQVEDINNPTFTDEIVSYVQHEFQRRRTERLAFELQWQLNMNFIDGNQYCDINMYTNSLMDVDKMYFWEQREIFNHIAPIIETRLAKLGRLRPKMTVIPATSDLKDISTAKVCKNILSSVHRKLKIESSINYANSWMEICGTVFWNNLWNPQAGKLIGYIDGQAIYEGDVSQYVIPAFEMYPESNYSADVDSCKSIIHAKAYSIDDIYYIWNRKVSGKDVNVYSLSTTTIGTGGLGYNATVPKVAPTVQHDSEIVLEYTELPSKKYPQGRMIIVAGDQLLSYGPLPYSNKEDGKYGHPYSRQICVSKPGCFWGTAAVERLIPIQRAYNAVKNRKHDYLNRAAIGVYDYEKNSIDTDIIESIQDDGITPGMLIPRKAGSEHLHPLDIGTLPAQFEDEEAKLEQEFILISGVSEISRYSKAPTGADSGIALEILKNEDDTRISLTADNIRTAHLENAKQILRLYKQYVNTLRIDRIAGENNDVMVEQWTASDITSDDVIFETDSDMNDTPAQRRAFVQQLIQMGILVDPQTGKISKRMRSKMLEMLNLGNWESADDIDQLHINKATKENMGLEKGNPPQIEYIDDDDIHVYEHTRYMLSQDYAKLKIDSPEFAQVMLDHYNMHLKSMLVKQQQLIETQQMMAPPQVISRQIVQ